MKHIALLLLALTATLSANPAPPTPLERLQEGNKRYVQDALEHPNKTAERRLAMVCKQEPFAIVVGCADSRVSPEIIFDQGIGDLFVVRVAGNVIGPLERDSIDYAALYLHSSVILILGHENCGAVQAVVQGKTAGIEAVAALIEPAAESAKKSHPEDALPAAIKANALRMRDLLLKTPVVEKLVSEGKLQVYAGYYELTTGKVEIL